MKKMNMKLLALIPAFTLVSVVGAGFATWYFGDSNSNLQKDANVEITSSVAQGFTITHSGDISLVADQKTNRADGRPVGDVCNGIYLSTEDASKNLPTSLDGFVLEIAVAEGNEEVNDQTAKLTLNWTAQWTGTNATSIDEALSLERTGSVDVTLDSGQASVVVVANSENRASGTYDIDNLSETAMDNGETSYADNIADYGTDPSINLGINYTSEPTTTETYNTLAGYINPEGGAVLRLNFSLSR